MDRSKLVWLDLCSGLGGASQPALDRGWKVIRVDIDPRFKPDIVADVCHLPLKGPRWREHLHPVNELREREMIYPDVLWASPPCKDFSRHGMKCFNPNPPAPDLSIAIGVASAIRDLHPHWWVVENVWASRPWLCKIFGQVRARPPGHAIWSNLGFLLPNVEPHKGSAGYWSTGRWGPTGNGGANADESAVIPYEIGEAICLAVERRLLDNEEQGERER